MHHRFFLVGSKFRCTKEIVLKSSVQKWNNRGKVTLPCDTLLTVKSAPAHTDNKIFVHVAASTGFSGYFDVEAMESLTLESVGDKKFWFLIKHHDRYLCMEPYSDPKYIRKRFTAISPSEATYYTSEQMMRGVVLKRFKNNNWDKWRITDGSDLKFVRYDPWTDEEFVIDSAEVWTRGIGSAFSALRNDPLTKMLNIRGAVRHISTIRFDLTTTIDYFTNQGGATLKNNFLVSNWILGNLSTGNFVFCDSTDHFLANVFFGDHMRTHWSEQAHSPSQGFHSLTLTQP